MTFARHRRWLPNRLVALGIALTTVMTVSMLVVEQIGVDALTRPASWQTDMSIVVAAVSIALLTSDVILPIPSSLVLIGNGAVFGATLGSLISVAGLVTGAWLGYAIGALGGPAAQRIISERDRRWLSEFADRHGPWAVAATRAVPLASELMAVLSGATRMRPMVFAAVAVIGSVAVAAPLALLGDGVLPGRSAIVITAAASVAGLVVWSVRRHLLPPPGRHATAGRLQP